MPGASFRTWGDGVGDGRKHVIGAIDLHSEPEDQYIACEPCGTYIPRGIYLSIDRAWDAHRGLEYHPPRYGILATNSEVHEFLKKVDNPQYESSMTGAKYSNYVSRPDLTEVFDLFERLAKMQEECTCATGPVTSCPNYLEGD